MHHSDNFNSNQAPLTGHLAPLSRVKMLWWPLQNFDIHLHMAFPTIPLPRERDQAIMETFHAEGLHPDMILGLGRCRGVLKAIFLSDITTADGRYLKILSLIQEGQRQNQHSNFLGRTKPKMIGTCGSTSGTNLHPQGIHSKSRQATGPTSLIAYGNGTIDHKMMTCKELTEDYLSLQTSYGQGVWWKRNVIFSNSPNSIFEYSNLR